MSLHTLVSLSGIPGLETGVSLLGQTYQRIDSIKLYKRQCQDLNNRCTQLLVALRDSLGGQEGTPISRIVDELEPIIERVHRKVSEWSSWGQLNCFLRQRDIKDGLEQLHRELDGAVVQFQVQMQMEASRSTLDLRQNQEQFTVETRELLLTLIKDNNTFRDLLSMQNPVAVERMMEGLQTQLRENGLESVDKTSLKEGLWRLHTETAQLPPLTDLSGQITMSSQFPVIEGTSNDIYQGVWLDREVVALRLPRALASKREVQDQLEREVAIWRQLDHENVIPLYGIVYLNKELYSVSPWMDNGTVMDYASKHLTIDCPKLLNEIASGLEYLHSKDIVHGDLRGANILVTKEGVARLYDFGVSKFLEDCKEKRPSTAVSNVRWAAPEVLADGMVSKPSDVWSYGMVCLEILTGEPPFEGLEEEEVTQHIKSGKIPDRPGRIVALRGLSPDMWDLMRRCWSSDPAPRPSMKIVKGKLSQMRGVSDEHKSAPARINTTFNPRTGSRPSTTESKISLSTIGSGHLPSSSPINGHGRFFSTPALYAEPEDLLSPPGKRSSRTGWHNPWEQSPSQLNPSSPTTSTSSISPISPFSRGVPVASTSKGPPGLVDDEFGYEPVSPSSLPNHYGLDFGTRPGIMKRTMSRMSSKSTASTHSADATPSLTSIEEATKSPLRICNVSRGEVLSGTLDGLVDCLITNLHSRQYRAFRDAFFIGCSEFTTADTLFERLSHRFNQTERDMMATADERVATQYSIFVVISDWLDDQNIPPSDALLSRMKAFCERAMGSRLSITVVDQAVKLREKIDKTMINGRLSKKTPRHLRGPVLQSADIKSRDLAIALTIVEGDNYAALQPSDYIRHLTGKPSDNLIRLYETNNKIFSWVIDSILYYEEIEDRAQVLKMFVLTAVECQKLRNFSSSIAISTALHSAPVENLKLTRDALTDQTRRKLDKLGDLTNPESNHHRYRAAITNSPDVHEQHCIPWIAIHLKDLQKVLRENPITVQVDNHRLLNFQRYLKLTDKMREVLHFKSPPVEEFRHSGQAAYLDKQLQKVVSDRRTQEKFLERSSNLAKQEAKANRQRKPQLKVLGFKTS